MFLNLLLIRSFVRVFFKKLQLMVWENRRIKLRIKNDLKTFFGQLLLNL